ncbi:MAG: insulinase family protein [Burkholderiales bacterium]|jgi:zinc protease|nr:insulinase family protein [Burkholderiales bacterium]
MRGSNPRAARRALALGLVCAAQAAAAAQGDVHTRTLANGMQVIVMEDHRAPTAASMVWYRAGSMDESSGTTGVAHVLEHMMFKGTPTHPGDTFNRVVAAAGGRDNAFTNRDYTAYFQQVAVSKLETMVVLEADRMAHLQLTAADFEKEIKVVMEERRLRTDDQPRALLYEQMMATAYTAVGYRWPVIGWMADLEHMTVDDARAWYQAWYVPNNAAWVVVGDVQPEAAFAMAEKHFGAIPARPLPPRKPQIEPPQRGLKRLSVKAPAELPYVLMAWHVPALRDVEHDWEPYALTMLAGVLDGNDAARLDTRLVKTERIAINAGASYDDTHRGPAQFFLEGTPAPGRTAAELEAALRRELARVANEPIDPAELERVKAQVIASQVFQRDSMFFQAMQIGKLRTVGLPFDSADVQAERLRAVTAEQVQQVARRWFVDDALTVAVLEPQPGGATRTAADANGGGR